MHINTVALRFDSSYDRGSPLPSPIGVGRLIKGRCLLYSRLSSKPKSRPEFSYHENTNVNSKLLTGWDEGVPQMSLGEKAILDITP